MDRQQALTAKQQRIYDYLRLTILEKGFPPSVREICAEMGLSSPSTVHAHLSALAEKGYIRRDPARPRAIEITMRDTGEYFPFPAGALRSSRNDEMEPLTADHVQIPAGVTGLRHFMG